MWSRILGMRLISKLAGANVIVVAAAIVLEREKILAGDWGEMVAIAIALSAACFASLALIKLALRPVDQLVLLSDQISAGDLDARLATSPYADEQLTALGVTLNSLLDTLALERKHIQALGAEVIYAQDAECARVSRELHDSVAQTLAAARFQLTAATTHCKDADIRNRLAAISGMVGTVLEEVRNVSYSLHPRVAEDLGLESALQALAAQVHERSGVKVKVESRIVGGSVPRPVVVSLFRVAQESLRNIERHARARNATVTVFADPGSFGVEVSDDGCGFDTDMIQRRNGMSGLASIRDRVTLAGGMMKIDSGADRGTRIIAEMKTSHP